MTKTEFENQIRIIFSDSEKIIFTYDDAQVSIGFEEENGTIITYTQLKEIVELMYSEDVDTEDIDVLNNVITIYDLSLNYKFE